MNTDPNTDPNTDHPNTDLNTASARVRDARRITQKVWDGRPYVAYDAGDWDTALAREGLARYLGELPRGADGTSPVEEILRGWVGQRPGLWMTRHPLPGTPRRLQYLRRRAGGDADAQAQAVLHARLEAFDRREADIPGPLNPQLRPFKSSEYADVDKAEDGGLYLGKPKHGHVATIEHRHTPEGEETRLPKARWINGALRTIVLGRSGDLLDHLGVDYADLGFGDAEIVGYTEHAPLADMGEWHQHGVDWKKHLAKDERKPEHTGVAGVTEHSHVRRGKYVYLPESGEDCQRIDVHPLAWPLLQAGGSVAFWAFEGVLKGDAILSANELPDGTPTTPAFDTGSVNSWKDPYRFDVMYPLLRGFDLTVVVPDSDWVHNDQVRKPVEACVRELRAEGVNAVAAAPMSRCGDPRCPGKRVEGHGDDCKVGVDDMLAGSGFRGNETLGDMVVQGEVALDPIDESLAKDPRRAETMRRVEDLALRIADASGRARLAYSWAARQPEVQRGAMAVRRAVLALEQLGRLKRVQGEHFHGPRPYGHEPTVVQLAGGVLARRKEYAPTLRDYAAARGIERATFAPHFR